MKKMMMATILAACLASGTAYASSNDGKIGTVDLQRAVSESKEGIAARAGLQKKAEVLNAELRVLVAEVEKLKTELEKGSDKLSADERAEKGRLLQKRARDLQNRQREAQEELKQVESDYLKKILAKFGVILTKIGEEESYTAILDRNNGVYYAGKDADVTAQLVERADQDYQKK
ncbi:OmpH family outer membrane protein [Geomesophilobacter sediminis]|uniref:OmpH family outer membrane protein n=1 Tax=Geomesophilobacter sediminis TaxID=2798584 RepID=A0A8J7J146_9BACT|nr:OmpH family outer membrane protein [Geomesophilobacter sediminis]MBJ6724303.1 OmpH family outer membrane protein [Geomesophilobacter sediminis]